MWPERSQQFAYSIDSDLELIFIGREPQRLPADQLEQLDAWSETVFASNSGS